MIGYVFQRSGNLSYKQITMVQLHPYPPNLKMDKHKKLQELKTRKEKYSEKLQGMYKNFRGVVHENSLSELRYSEIKVYEDLLNSVNDEIRILESN